MEENLSPPDAGGTIYDQFDVQVTGELLPGGASIVDGYFCRLARCRGEEKVFKTRRGLILHRQQIHSRPSTGTHKIPKGDQIRQWLLSGKPRPREIPRGSPEGTESPDGPAGPRGPSLLCKLLHCNSDAGESELPPATLESNIYEQFNIRHEPGEAGESPYVGYVCLLSQCHKEKVCFSSHAKWTRHRRNVHNETAEAQSIALPDGYEIREWVILNKPRPYEVQVKPKAWKKGILCPVDPAVFAEFDVKGTAEDDELRFFCLLDSCPEKDVAFQGSRCWRSHRVKHHMSHEYEDGEYTLPSQEIIREWMNAGKPPHYRPQKRVRTYITVDPPATESTELHNREVNPAPSNVSNEVNEQKSQVLCLLPGDKRPNSGNQHSQGDHQELHKLLPLAGSPSLRRSKNLARVGRRRPPTHPVEIPRESRRRRGRPPRNADVCQCSSDSEPAHQKKKKRHSIHSTNRRHSTDSSDSDSSDLVALRVVAPGEDPTGSFWKKFMEETNPTRDETPPSQEAEEEADAGTELVDEESAENVDGLSMDHDHNLAADMEEFGEEPREDSVPPEGALSSLPYSQQELHASGAADVTEIDEDPFEAFEALDIVLPSQLELQNVEVVGHSSIQTQDFQGVMDEHQQNLAAEMTKAGEEASEEFEAPDNVSPSQPELQNIKVAGHSSIQPQDFQGMTDEHQQNSTAEMTDGDEEAPKDSFASENVLPSLQNSTAEMGELEEEEPEDFVAPENALNALMYTQPNLWELSSVQPQDFQGDVLETLPNPTAEMNEVVEEALEDSVAIENVLSSLPCSQPEFGITGIEEHGKVLPQEFPGEFHELLPNTQLAEFGEAHEEIINPWNLNPSEPYDVSEQIALSPLWHLDGETFKCLPEDFPEVNWPNSNEEDNLKYSAEMTGFGEKAPQDIVAAGNVSLSVQSKSSEQNASSTLQHYFTDALQFSPKDTPGETDNHMPNSKMAEVGEENPEGFVASENFVPCFPLMQSEGTKIANLEGPIDIQAAPIQEFAPPFSMDQVFVMGPNAAGTADAGMAEVGVEAPEGFVTPENLAPWFQFMQSEGFKLPSSEGPIEIQAAPIQESVPSVHMDPGFIEQSSAGWMSEEFAAPGNFVPSLPSNGPQETGDQLHVSSLNTNASLTDDRNIDNEPTFHWTDWTDAIIYMDIASINEAMAVVPLAPSTQLGGTETGSIFMQGNVENSMENQVDPVQEFTTLMDVDPTSMNEPVVVDPSAPSTQPGGGETGGSIFMEGSAEISMENQVDPVQEFTTLMDVDPASMNETVVVVPFDPSTQPGGGETGGSIFMQGSAEISMENQVDPVQEFTTLMDVERAFESAPDLPPLIDDLGEHPQEFFRPEEVALSPQPMQQLFNPGNSELSDNVPAVRVLQNYSLIDMAAGSDYESTMCLQTDEISAWMFNY